MSIKIKMTKMSMKLSKVKKETLVTRRKMSRKVLDSKEKKGLLIQRNLLTWICQMICSLTTRETKAPKVSRVIFIFVTQNLTPPPPPPPIMFIFCTLFKAENHEK